MSTDANRGKWYGAWCAYFSALLEERRLNPTDFATLVGDRQNNIWQYQRGVIRPPLRKLESWARKLKLDEGERGKFIRLGRIAHAPKEIREEIEELRRRAEESEARLKDCLDRHPPGGG